MEKYIQAARKGILKLLEKIYNTFNEKIKVAIICYREFKNEKESEFLDFTDNFTTISNFLKSV